MPDLRRRALQLRRRADPCRAAPGDRGRAHRRRGRGADSRRRPGDAAGRVVHLGHVPSTEDPAVTFIQPPFWAQGPRAYAVAPHAVSVLVTPPALEPLTLDQGKLRAGLDWVAGDPRDALMTGFIQAARSQVEQDTGLALLTQTRDV